MYCTFIAEAVVNKIHTYIHTLIRYDTEMYASSMLHARCHRNLDLDSSLCNWVPVSPLAILEAISSNSDLAHVLRTSHIGLSHLFSIASSLCDTKVSSLILKLYRE